MKRHVAIATAASLAITAGSAVVASAAVGGVDLFGFAKSSEPTIESVATKLDGTGSTTTRPAVTVTRTEFDDHVVVVPAPTVSIPSSTDRPATTASAATASTTSSTSTSTSTTTRPNVAPTAAQRVTLNSQGGTATVEWTSTSVKLISSAPVAGYRVEVEGTPREVEVEFESATHTSKISFELEDGTLRRSVREQDRVRSSSNDDRSREDEHD